MLGRINSVVVGLIIDGIQKHAPEALPPQTDIFDHLDDELGVPLEPYRRFLNELIVRGGAKSLLTAGKSIENLVDPILFALLNSDSPALIVEKEARLGRFIHSRHIVRVVEQGQHHIVLQHLSTTNEPPQRTEDIAAAGQHITLFEQIGCLDLKLNFPKSNNPLLCVYEANKYTEPSNGDCSIWQFTWRNFSTFRRPMPGLDELLLAKDDRLPLKDASSIVTRIQKVVQTDLSRTWTINDVTTAMKTSARNLQRTLAKEQTKFSDVLDYLRTSEAKRLLEDSDLSVTNIGYLCGFADTSHFSRRFKLRFKLSPSQYRKQYYKDSQQPGQLTDS